MYFGDLDAADVSESDGSIGQSDSDGNSELKHTILTTNVLDSSVDSDSGTVDLTLPLF